HTESSFSPDSSNPHTESSFSPDSSTPSLDELVETFAREVGETIQGNSQIEANTKTRQYQVHWSVDNHHFSLNIPGIQQATTTVQTPETTPPRNPTISQSPVSDTSNRFFLNPSLNNVTNPDQLVTLVDQTFTADYDRFLDEDISKEKITAQSIRDTLQRVETETGKRAVILYILSQPQQLELVLVLPEGTPIRRSIPQANAQKLRETVRAYRRGILSKHRPNAYFAPSRQLYDWIIAPLEKELDHLNIDTLVVSLDAGLRTLPLAALHDGQQFLIEKYSIGQIPSMSLTDHRYQELKQANVLGMGRSHFTEKDPLPAVPYELSLITETLGQGKSFLNEAFTYETLKTQSSQGYDIVHLATHATIQRGNTDQSYLQLWDQHLKLPQLRNLGWYQASPIELLVLSACQTALGDKQAELGFAGLSVQTGAKSALASLWNVSDWGTLVMMSQFYEGLYDPQVKIKVEALRQAQLALLNNHYTLPSDSFKGLGDGEQWDKLAQRDFSHPYYWAAFTMVGSPW
ncbi:CHAT domain-containing protein, partial [Spirulina sp. CS-785/01]|uniref:CHAT domain-containing protein n=1 Tax=Spirulina sp. CS-785/01 TaxID=3021716 RepID=UPI002331002A